VAGSYEYRRYESAQTPLWTPLRFPGQYYDAESDSFENWNRYYDPATGRYLGPEPTLENPVETKPVVSAGNALPAYAYASHNPIHFTDRTGREFDANGVFYLQCGTLRISFIDCRNDRCVCKALTERNMLNCRPGEICDCLKGWHKKKCGDNPLPLALCK
jgi:RHS repeat-associated protein